MSVRILVFGIFLHYISFSSADGVLADGVFANGFPTDGVSTDGGFTDGLSWFNDENIDPLQNTYSLDPTSSGLVSEDLDGFDTFLNDPGSDLFASSVDPNDPTLVADCTSIKNDDYLGKKKARVRRQTACRNPASNFDPNLSLPTLDQVFPADNENPVPPNNEDPVPPKIDRGKKVMNEIVVPGAWFLELVDTYYRSFKECSHNMICSSNQKSDVSLESNGVTWTLRNAESGKFVFFLFTSTHLLFSKHFSSLYSEHEINLMLRRHTLVGLYGFCAYPRRRYCCSGPSVDSEWTGCRPVESIMDIYGGR